MKIKKLSTLALSIGLIVGTMNAPQVYAQMTSAAAGGRVLSAQGAPVSGAQVEIVHIPTGTVSRLTTDAEGRFSARGLRVGGPYRIIASGNNLEATLDGQYFELSDTSALELVLASSASVSVEEITVTGSRVGSVFDSSRMGSGSVVGRDQIEALPSIGRNIQDYIRTDPRIAQTDKERGEISAGGQNTRFNNIRIDGVSTNDAFGLESNNLPTARQPISIDSIESINIALTNFDVSRSGFTGASVDAVTRSGTNEITGTVYGVFGDSDWTGKRNGNRFTGFQDESTMGFTIGAPIIRDRLFVFGSYEKFTRSAAAPTFGPAGSNAAQIVTGITTANIQDVQNIAKNVWGFEAGSFEAPASLDTDIEDILLKVDWNINDNHRASFRYNSTEQVEPFLRNFDARQLSLSSFWQNNIKEFESYVAQLYSDWTPNLYTELSVSRADQSSLWDIGQPLPSIRICLNSATCSGADSLWIGSERFRHVNELITQTDNVTGAATWYNGRHEVKFGAEYQSQDLYNLFGRDQFGVYDFYGIEAFRQGRPGSYSLFYPTQGDVRTRAAEWTLENVAFFVQDTIDLTNTLNITAGLRLDIPRTNDIPLFNAGASTAFGLRNDSTINGNRLLQPRLGFNWQPEMAQRVQVRGGVGLFQGIAAKVWLSNPFSNNSVNTGAITSNNPTADRITFSPDPNNQPGSRPPPGQGGIVDFVDPSLKLPSSWKANLAVDYELPWYEMVASAEVVMTEVQEGIRYEKPNLGAPRGTTPDGRPHYWTTTVPGVFTGAAAQNTANRNRAYSVDTTIARPTSKGDGEQLTLSLQGRPDYNWSWGVAYTRTNATEVNTLTSSQAASNWNNAIRADRNADVAENSVYAIKDRLTASLNYRKEFIAGYETSFGLFFEARSGKPFTYTFVNDANGDGRSGVDPFYVPAAPGEVIFTGGSAMEAAFFNYLDSQKYLARDKGGIATVNGAQAPYVRQFDLRISQEFPFIAGRKGEVWFDIANLGNMLNKDWGVIREVGFPGGSGVARFAGIDPATGKYVYNFNQADIRDLTLRDNRGESRWSMQMGARIRF
ncbi:MAG: carboxypeptidase regulatory-like domain-containing protein [Pseudohongiella sp.]|nr:carboxypeptidase regulatory-like domain-containing protein [Pseudohongiella sp.]